MGAGGIGKTRLALQAALEQLSTFKDGVFFAPLGEVTAPNLLAAALADKVGCPLSGPGEAEQQLVNTLAERELLLILDNFEHLLTSSTGRTADSENLLLKVLAGARQADLRDGTTQDEGILRLSGDYLWRISETARFNQTLAIESGSDNTYLEAKSSLSADIRDSLALVVSYTIKSNSDVLPKRPC